MPVVARPIAPTHQLPGAEFTSIATPSTGSLDTAVWEVRLEPGHAGAEHQLTRQEVFIVTSGVALATLAGEQQTVAPGDLLVVPANTPFALAAAGPEALVAYCCFPTDGQAFMAGGEPFTPPWAV
jgi:quercetin dioxygenase-like cupin family protein